MLNTHIFFNELLVYLQCFYYLKLCGSFQKGSQLCIQKCCPPGWMFTQSKMVCERYNVTSAQISYRVYESNATHIQPDGMYLRNITLYRTVKTNTW